MVTRVCCSSMEGGRSKMENEENEMGNGRRVAAMKG